MTTDSNTTLAAQVASHQGTGPWSYG